MQFDLEDRTLRFGIGIVRLCKSLSYNTVNNKLIDQLVRSGTSVGANYREANETETKKDFKNKILIAKKEAKETEYWLKLMVESNPDRKNDLLIFEKEALELVKILAAIYAKS